MARIGHTNDEDEFVFETHEVFANTFAACLFKRTTFDAIGGLRALDLPNGFGDVVFNFECLTRGWHNLYLGHLEGTHLDTVLWPIAKSAADLLTSDRLACVRECAAQNCGWLFMDNSPNQRRRWCNMKICGNRAKARRHYERNRTSTAFRKFIALQTPERTRSSC